MNQRLLHFKVGKVQANRLNILSSRQISQFFSVPLEDKKEATTVSKNRTRFDDTKESRNPTEILNLKRKMEKRLPKGLIYRYTDRSSSYEDTIPFFQCQSSFFSTKASINVDSNDDVSGQKKRKSWDSIIASYGEKSNAQITEEDGAKKDNVNAVTDQAQSLAAKLTVYKRNGKGSKKCQHMRQSTILIPGIIYGGKNQKKHGKGENIRYTYPDKKEDRILVATNKFEFTNLFAKLHDSIECKLIDIEVIDEEKNMKYIEKCIPRQLTRDPVTGEVTAVNFVRYRPGLPVDIPIRFVNEDVCTPIKRGGYLICVNRKVRCVSTEETLPEYLTIDLMNVKVKQVLGLKDVQFPPGVTAKLKIKNMSEEHYAIGIVHGKKGVGGVMDKGED